MFCLKYIQHCSQYTHTNFLQEVCTTFTSCSIYDLKQDSLCINLLDYYLFLNLKNQLGS